MVLTIRGNQNLSGTQTIFSCVIIITIAIFIDRYIYLKSKREFQNVDIWLDENGLSKHSEAFRENGITNIEKVVTLSKLELVKIFKFRYVVNLHEAQEEIQKILRAKEKFVKRQQYITWVEKNSLEIWDQEFHSLGIHTLKDVIDKYDFFKNHEKYKEIFPAFIELESQKKHLDSYQVFYRESILRLLSRWTLKILKLTIVLLVAAGCFIFICIAYVFHCMKQSFRRRNQQPVSLSPTTVTLDGIFRTVLDGFFGRRTRGLPTEHAGHVNTSPLSNTPSRGFSSIFGFSFSAKKSKVSWKTTDYVVGNEVIVVVQFRRDNGLAYKASDIRTIKCEAVSQQSFVECTVVLSKESANQVEIYFTPTLAVEYTISILAEGQLVDASPYKLQFLPGKIDPFKSSLVVPSCLLILEEGKREMLTFDERDKFGNPCRSSLEELLNYQFVICEFKESGKRISPPLSFDVEDITSRDRRNKAWLNISDPGVYTADVFYNNEPMSENVVLLVLSESEMGEVNKNISTPQWSLYYEAHYYTEYVSEGRKSILCEDVDLPNNYHKTLINMRPAVDSKKRKVYCYISPKFLTAKEYYFKIFSKRQHTFRIKPSVKIHLHTEDNNETSGDATISYKCFTIEASKNESLTLFCHHRNILVATFVKFMLKNIGGSEQFENKRRYFYKELFHIGSGKSFVKTFLRVQRATVVKDTMKFVKPFSKTDWWKDFYISFQGELGMDYGGVSREWVRVILDELFHTDGGLFRRFNKDDQQALIHPNPYRIEEYSKLKYFEFAGQMIGKCLVECSCDQARQQYAKARFTRSFLSQLLGLGVSWKHFESDDKEYYKGKIKYILENDPTDLDVYFSEDVYDNKDHFVKTLDLKPNGSHIAVTESNKLEYLQRLAEYRLAESVKHEIASFLKGLNSIVEEGLLSIFDENELELLICGMETISVSDLKANCEVEKDFFIGEEVVTWFWAVISGFSQEELTRLLQFSTGCSQLPPTGFAGLVPKFQIKTHGKSSSLPTSHTCFNMLVLPCYQSSEELKEKLLLAINEGSEGFGLV